jgi:hypothetical protein
MKRVLAVVAALAAVLGLTTGVAFGDNLDQDGFASQAYGGGMLSNNGQLDWGVPAQAYSNNLRLRYVEDYTTSFTPPNGIWIRNPFTLRVMDLDNGALVTTLKPMTLTVHYDDADLGGRDPSTLRVVRLVDVAWVDLPSTVDTNNHVVMAQINQSADYGLLSGYATPGAVQAPSAAPAQAGAAVPDVPMSSGVTGMVFFDRNGNGIFDGGDFPIAKAGLKISSGTWSAFTTTDGNGAYAFWSLRESAYTVELVVGPEWAFTTPNVVSGIVVTGQADSRGTANFGMWYSAPQ